MAKPKNLIRPALLNINTGPKVNQALNVADMQGK